MFDLIQFKMFELGGMNPSDSEIARIWTYAYVKLRAIITRNSYIEVRYVRLSNRSFHSFCGLCSSG
ncbi:hypothetical protein VIBNISOn1_1100007 [Vibrio nigripulchritudo SOn1]|uniref:Uncharacterized protein n=1 Tax=Vibrio nigripulchritudo SOn1 TaxID=1238450 RepID=A0AAV2VIT9_9VIBR|nr:hypothetical protein VIBNISOn1_1100007 [Vibrio nigripulchritudo SOn1]